MATESDALARLLTLGSRGGAALGPSSTGSEALAVALGSPVGGGLSHASAKAAASQTRSVLLTGSGARDDLALLRLEHSQRRAGAHE